MLGECSQEYTAAGVWKNYVLEPNLCVKMGECHSDTISPTTGDVLCLDGNDSATTSGCNVGSGGAHNLLSATHTDTTAASRCTATLSPQGTSPTDFTSLAPAPWLPSSKLADTSQPT